MGLSLHGDWKPLGEKDLARPECYLELIIRGRKAEPALSWNIPSFLPGPQALSSCIACCGLLTEEMLIHGPELQETLFPGEETSLAVLPAPSLPVAATCPALGLHPGRLRRGRALSSLASEVTFPGPAPHHASLGFSSLTSQYLSSPSPLLPPSLPYLLQPPMSTPSSPRAPCISQSMPWLLPFPA